MTQIRTDINRIISRAATPVRNRAYIPVKSSRIRYYVRVPLYFETAPNVFQLYKPVGMEITDIRFREGMHPRLFIQQADRLEAIREVHKGFNLSIARSIEAGDVRAVKSTLCDLVAETLTGTTTSIYDVKGEFRTFVLGGREHSLPLKAVCWPQQVLFITGVLIYAVGHVMK